MALGKHLIQAVPSVYALQCLNGKVDNNNIAVLYLGIPSIIYDNNNNIIIICIYTTSDQERVPKMNSCNLPTMLKSMKGLEICRINKVQIHSRIPDM